MSEAQHDKIAGGDRYITAWIVAGRRGLVPYNGCDLEKARAFTEEAAEFLRKYLRGLL